jgi:hypothetical protein
MTMAGVIKFFVAGGWKYAAGGAVMLALAGLGYALYSAGFESAEQKCNVAALKAENEKLKTELATAHDLIVSAQATAKLLRAARVTSEARQQQLAAEIDLLRRQGAKGKTHAKRDALVDARCDFTARGVQFFSRPRAGNDKRAAGAGLPAGGRGRAAPKR